MDKEVRCARVLQGICHAVMDWAWQAETLDQDAREPDPCDFGSAHCIQGSGRGDQ